MNITRSDIINLIGEITHFAQINDFSGYSKHDALNSPLLRKLSFNSRYLRLFFIQSIMRFPFNVRPICMIHKERNPKGIALFACGYLKLHSVTHNEVFKQIAIDLLEWLLKNHSNKSNQYHGHCWGYNFPWQSLYFYAPKYFPNLTVSVFTGEAFLLGSIYLNSAVYLEIAKSVAWFLLNDLPVLMESKDEKCIGYIPGHVSEMVININAMAAAFLAKLFVKTSINIYKQNAVKMINFVVRNAIDNMKWTYTTNVKRSYIDNYHTGGIIDGLFETMTSLKMWNWKETLMRAIQYYSQYLFTREGAPKYRNNTRYPFDVHGSSQGIITFAKLSQIDKRYLTYAEQYFEWAYRYLYSNKGFFYYQKNRFYTKRFTLMRWCNAWMLYAISELLNAQDSK